MLNFEAVLVDISIYLLHRWELTKRTIVYECGSVDEISHSN